MRNSRVYTADELSSGQNLELQQDMAHYVRSVLRLKQGQSLILFNGLGGEFESIINEISRKRVIVLIGSAVDRTVESSLHITLGLGISRGDRMDWAVQKSVELGVNSITPLITERCVVKLKADKQQQRLQHWTNIVQHATEQSGRTRLPAMKSINYLDSWVIEQQALKIFLDPYAEKSLSDLVPLDLKVTLLSGPEGGFSDNERKLAISAGFTPVRLGKRILRTETAVLSALSAVQMLWGDF